MNNAELVYEEDGHTFVSKNGKYYFIFKGGYTVDCRSREDFISFAEYYLDKSVINRILEHI